MKRVLSAVSVLIFTFMLGQGCNSSPTVPVPPPTVITSIETSAPDNLGNVTVLGAPATAQFGDIVSVFNDDTGTGAVKDAEVDGSFEIIIAAEVNHTLIVYIIRDSRLAAEGEFIVD